MILLQRFSTGFLPFSAGSDLKGGSFHFYDYRGAGSGHPQGKACMGGCRAAGEKERDKEKKKKGQN